jgi:S1-C subfamily serine protease
MRTVIAVAALLASAGAGAGVAAIAVHESTGSNSTTVIRRPVTVNAAPAASTTPAGALSVSQIYQRSIDGVVEVLASGPSQGSFFGNQPTESAQGTGFEVDRKGDIVTNYHVIAGAWEAGSASVTVRQFDNSYLGTIGKVDPTDDLAVVGIHERLTSLAAAPARPKQAQPVMALGSPQGFDGTVATGIVSGYRSIAGADYIQFSAPISPGNSGGPLVDANGRVVGVASAKWVGTGVEALAFAIPVQTVCTVLVSCRSAG